MMLPWMRICPFPPACWAALACLAFIASTARAGYVSQTIMLNQSNELEDNVNYGSVLVEAFDGLGDAGGGLAAGDVRLTYTAAKVPAYGDVGQNFGFHTVGFNTDLAFSATQITGPKGWTLKPDGRLSGFGRFAWKASGGARSPSVVLLISGLDDDALLTHFLIDSKKQNGRTPAQGSVHFAGHVQGFTKSCDTNNQSSHWIGGSGVPLPPNPGGSNETPETPEPTSLALGGLGLAGLALGRRYRRSRRAAQAYARAAGPGPPSPTGGSRPGGVTPLPAAARGR